MPASAATTIGVQPSSWRSTKPVMIGDDGGRLGGVALEAADFQREPGPVHQQADHDLRVDAAFLGVADLAQLVFVLGLEVQRRHVIEQQAQAATAGGVGKHFSAIRSRYFLGPICSRWRWIVR